ncbi:Hypothetical predicted protein [Marmota monax]|uniref:Uncharacterized protein n=1 Tax=Marmota monax TaxID=9995 RepID=A0A5E4B0G1_MARMO|nr:hypothetical protein GHT09_018010 [Marmota monax]VTJ63213.1 Hypothetical predicted protein [Marmota monax]
MKYPLTILAAKRFCHEWLKACHQCARHPWTAILLNGPDEKSYPSTPRAVSRWLSEDRRDTENHLTWSACFRAASGSHVEGLQEY